MDVHGDLWLSSGVATQKRSTLWQRHRSQNGVNRPSTRGPNAAFPAARSPPSFWSFVRWDWSGSFDAPGSRAIWVSSTREGDTYRPNRPPNCRAGSESSVSNRSSTCGAAAPADWWYDCRGADGRGERPGVLRTAAVRDPPADAVSAACIDRCPGRMSLSFLDPLQVGRRPDRTRVGPLSHATARGNARTGRGGLFLEFGHVPLGGTEHLHEPCANMPRGSRPIGCPIPPSGFDRGSRRLPIRRFAVRPAAAESWPRHPAVPGDVQPKFNKASNATSPSEIRPARCSSPS